eukprot:1157628-Pelagomonas_calceolata.AAC.6
MLPGCPGCGPRHPVSAHTARHKAACFLLLLSCKAPDDRLTERVATSQMVPNSSFKNIWDAM